MKSRTVLKAFQGSQTTFQKEASKGLQGLHDLFTTSFWSSGGRVFPFSRQNSIRRPPPWFKLRPPLERESLQKGPRGGHPKIRSKVIDSSGNYARKPPWPKLRESLPSTQLRLTGPKPKEIKVETFRINYLIRSPKVEKLGFEPVSRFGVHITAPGVAWTHNENATLEY